MARDPDATGIPVLVGPEGEGKRLDRVPLVPGSQAIFDEAWLQRLIHGNPECLPIAEIEPGLEQFRAICREMPTPHGPIDNLLMTPEGDIAIVETKLFRNPEARRRVLAQALDYAVALFGMDYATFEKAVLGGTFAPRPKPASLYEACTSPEQPREDVFVDAVVRNLRRGRILILIAGDGIRSETELLLGNLPAFANFHFTLALVELAVFRLPGSEQLLIRPRTLARTQTVVKRYAFDLAPAAVAASAIPSLIATAESAGSLSADAFWQALQERAGAVQPALEQLIQAAEPLGVYPEYLRSLNLKWDRPAEGNPVNLGYIQRNGTLWTDAAAWWAPRELAKRYVEEVCVVLGCDMHEMPHGRSWMPYRNGKPVRVQAVLDRLPDWIGPMQRFVAAVAAHDSRS